MVVDEPGTDRAAIMRWLRNYVSKPHPQLGRPGPVCPFVEPSLRTHCLHIDLVYLHDDVSLSTVLSAVREGAERFVAMEYAKRDRHLRALIVALPDVPIDRLTLLDRAHEIIKPEFVKRGLMVGQFHEHCDEPAARNEDFMVSRAPVPLFALRFMAFHDILFLHGRRDWFSAYRTHFGQLYGSDEKIDPLFACLFHQAEERFSCRA